MMGMEETLVQTFWRTICINTTSNRTVFLKILKKQSERDAMIVRRCSLILLSNSFIRLENLTDQGLVQFVFCLLTIMFILLMLEIQELYYQKNKGKWWLSSQMIIDLNDKLSKKESLNMEVTSTKHKMWPRSCNKTVRSKTKWF